MEKKYPTWDMFKLKYPSEQLQRERFEDLARALFCNRYGKKYGIFQYYNHAGNETDTVTDGCNIIGFNAKYFDNNIDEEQIKHSIITAHEWHPEQTIILIYTNLHFGNPQKGETKTKIQKDIDAFAAAKGLSVEWVNDKMILDQAVKITWVYEFFFEMESSLEKLVEMEASNTKSILAPIRTSIFFDKTEIRIDYSNKKEQVLNATKKNNHVVVYGEGGCGKTALIKTIWEAEEKNIPICIRKAQDIKSSRIDNLFVEGIDFFIDAYKDVDIKFMVIDSAEKIQDIDDTSTFETFITRLKDNGWSFIFTVRDGYLESLLEDLNILYGITPTLVKIEPLTAEELKKQAEKNNFELPLNEAFQERLCTLLYLDFYLKLYGSIDKNGSYLKFSELIWNKKITGNVTSDGKQIKRSQLFVNFIEQRIAKDCFYLNEEIFDPEVTQLLINDEVLARNNNGLFITHDIYEEWGLNKVINNHWQERSSIESFFESLCSSFLVRKAFRQWLRDNIESNFVDIKDLLSKSFDSGIEQHWRDEMLIGIMESSYAMEFLSKEKEVLVADEAILLNRIVFLLQIACKRVYKVITLKDGYEYPCYVPFGSGWDAVIHILFELRNMNLPLQYKLSVLKEWTLNNKDGETTKEAGLIALTIWSETENDDSYMYDKNLIKDLCIITSNSAKEIKTELSSIIKKIIKNKWNSHGDPYYELCHYILSNSQEADLLISVLPEDVFSIMNLFWRYNKESTNSQLFSPVDSSSRKYLFGLNEDELESSCGLAFAYQTPLYNLLKVRYWESVDYIVEFTNSIIDNILKNIPPNEKIEEITIHLKNGARTIQYGNFSLWGLYRGATNNTYPNIVQSMHMALEQILLELADEDDYDIVVKNSFDYILSKSKSVSLTAVVASVILAHPVKLREYAINLFKTIELFHWDTIRLNNEFQLSWLYGMRGLHNSMAAQERINTLQHPFRNSCLESLCIEYQYTYNSKIGKDQHIQLIKAIQSVLDTHYKKIETLDVDEKNVRNILLYRMDKRKHNVKVSKMDTGRIQIEMNPQMPEELKKYSEDHCGFITKLFRFGSVRIWCEKKFKNEDVSEYQQYEENPTKAIQDAKDVITAKGTQQLMLPMDEYVPANVAGVMLLFYEKELNDEDMLFCKSIVENVVEASLRKEYCPQLSDGLELCTHAMIILIKLYPDYKLKYVNMLADILCNHQDMGPKRICDYAIEAIVSCNDDELHNIVLAHYILRIVDNTHSIDAFISLDELIKNKLDNIDLESAEVLFELIPYGTNNKLFKAFISQLLSGFAETLKREDYHTRLSYSKYDRRLYLYKALAYYALHLEVEDVEAFMSPFMENLDCDSNSLDFIRQFLRAENELKKTSTFLKIWKLLYKSIINRCIGRNGDVLQTYLLADDLSVPKTREWHSFGKDMLWLYNNAVRDCGDSAATIYAIAKNLNFMAIKFIDEGIGWLYEITSKHHSLNLRDRERQTIFYMERFIGGVVRNNRTDIRKDKKKKDMLVTILTFMVERNSVQAFMLRDLIV